MLEQASSLALAVGAFRPGRTSRHQASCQAGPEANKKSRPTRSSPDRNKVCRVALTS